MVVVVVMLVTCAAAAGRSGGGVAGDDVVLCWHWLCGVMLLLAVWCCAGVVGVAGNGGLGGVLPAVCVVLVMARVGGRCCGVVVLALVYSHGMFYAHVFRSTFLLRVAASCDPASAGVKAVDGVDTVESARNCLAHGELAPDTLALSCCS